MIITSEFIYDCDHYVCHITEEKNMQSIIENGLLPLNGDRCRFAMDNRKGVFCLDGIHNVQSWAECLYEQYDLETLRLLRFNLKNRIWHIDSSNQNVLGFYLPRKVTSRKIDFLEIKDLMGENLPLTKLFDENFLNNVDESFNNYDNDKEIIVNDCRLMWEPIHQYKKIYK